MMFIGVEGCKKGWFAIKLTEGEEEAAGSGLQYYKKI